MTPHRTSRRAAFTLIELIVSMSVSVVVCGIAGSLVWNATKQRSEVAARGELIDMGSTALEMMIRYLREIPQNECEGTPTPCLNGNAQVTTATVNAIRWGDYGFRKSGSNLQMTTNNAVTWRTLATDVTAFSLTYYNRLGQNLITLSSPDDAPQNMRRIVISLTLSRANQTVVLRTGLYLRSFMNEVTLDP
jgi:prepilin-type N-terminal cleavage/methylation domain-containing protein